MASRAVKIDPKLDRINWSVAPLTGIQASFAVDSVTVQVNFEQHNPGVWIGSFAVERDDKPVLTLASEIFSGVMKTIKEFLQLREPSALVLHADDEGLAGAYEGYVQRVERQFRDLGYQVEIPELIDHSTEFRLRRLISAGGRS